MTFAPAEPRDAATVVVVREREDRVEIFCVERHRRSGFMGGALVFPGGKVDDADRDPVWARRTTPLGARALGLARDDASARAFAVAAVREALEEAAILPVVDDRVDADMAVALRASAGAAFTEVVERHDLVLDTARLEGLSRWITPVEETRRFDTRFYLLPLPHAQTGAHDDHETTRSLWATPEDILARWESGEVILAPPTSFTLELFVGARTVEEARAIARRQSLAPVQPRFTNQDGTMILTLPGDPLHPPEEGPPLYPDAPTRFVLKGGRFVSCRA